MHLHHPDHALPATEILFDTATLAERIRPWLPDLDFNLSIENIRYKQGTSCLVSYRLSSDAGDSHMHIKAYRRDDWSIRKRKLIDKWNQVLLDDDFAFALFQFPTDTKLPWLSKFIADADGFLAKVMFEKYRHEKIDRFETLAYKSNRRFTGGLIFKSGRKAVLKLHDPSTFNRVKESASILKRSLMVNSPDRIGRSNRYSSLAYDWVEGSPIDISKIGNAECENVMTSIFEYLDRLHIPLGSNHAKLRVSDPAEGVLAMGKYLGEIYLPIRAEALRIAEEILANLDSLECSTVIHGDFYDQQLLVLNGQVRACDFDNCCLGDPTTDLANFVAHLRYRACLGEIPMQLVEEIDHSAMRDIASRYGKSAISRYHWGQSASLFRLASSPFRSGNPDWICETATILKTVQSQNQSARPLNNLSTVEQPTAGSDSAAVEVAKSIELGELTNTLRQAIKSDPKLDFVGVVFENNETERMLRHHVPELESAYGAYRVRSVVAVRHKLGRRCLFEFVLSTALGLRSILGKVSAKRLDRKTLRVQSLLFNQCGFESDSADQISVPRTLGCCEPWNMWFQEKVAASPGIDYLSRDRLPPVTERISAAIAKLHACHLLPERQHSISDELSILDKLLNQSMSAMPSESPRIERILNSCQGIGESINERLRAPIHRDFYHDQIMFSEDRTFLVDLDLVTLGHPALDVGNFLAHLSEHGIREFGDANYWSNEEEQISSQYLDRMPECSRGEIVASKAISLARHIFISWAIPERRGQTRGIIDAVEELTTSFVADSRVAR